MKLQSTQISIINFLNQYMDMDTDGIALSVR